MSIEEKTSLERTVAGHMAAVSSRMGKRIAMGEEEAADILDPSKFLAGIRTKGGSNPRFIPTEVRSRTHQLESSERALLEIARATASAERLLMRSVKRLATGVKR
jgi:hypothetical protein